MFAHGTIAPGDTLMRKLFLAVMLAAPILLSACNTIAGLGKDVEAVGDAVTNSAEDAKN
jgi:predicted small secreted protein